MTDNLLVPNLNPGEIHRTEFTVKRSRFITSVARTRNSDEVDAFLTKIRTEFSDARHNCYAFNHGKGNSTAFIGCSDDGEPKGTAGQPMLNVLIHSGIGEITMVVTRYFGGILLGTGGLVKAYQDGVKQAMETLPVKVYEETTDFIALLPSYLVNQAIHQIKKSGGVIGNQSYIDDKVSMSINIALAKAAELKANLNNVCKGQAEITDL